MHITAVIPTYKRPQLLKRAVRSVLNQSYPHFTILISDNASGPETDVVVQELLRQDARIKLLKHPLNLGITGNFQAACMQVSTEYVCFLPDDDFYAPHFFEEALEAFSRYPDIAFAGGGGALFIDSAHNVRRQISSKKDWFPATGYYAPPTAWLAHLRSLSGIQLPPVLFKTTRVKEVGGFDKRLNFCIDTDLIAKCVARFPVYLITDRIFYFYYQNSESLTHLFDLFHQEKEAQYLHETLLHVSLDPQDSHEIDVWFKDWKTRISSKLYSHFLFKKDFQQAHLYAKKLFETTHSPRWKSRAWRTKLYSYMPYIERASSRINALEKSIRALRRKPQRNAVAPDLTYEMHPEAAYWKEYALSLER